MSEVLTKKKKTKRVTGSDTTNYPIADALKDAKAEAGMQVLARNENYPAGSLRCTSERDLKASETGGWKGKFFRLYEHSKRSGSFPMLNGSMKWYQESWEKAFPSVPFLDKDGKLSQEVKMPIVNGSLRKSW